VSSPYLSKSDFKVARTCATKLYYRKQRYPSTKSEDPYLEFLADGGFMVGKMAQIIHPGGVDLEALKGNPEELARKTAEYLKQDSVTLFEPAVLSGLLLARIDVLIKRGSTLELIEVKSKSYDSDEEVNHQNKGKRTTLISSKGIDSDWREYLEDVTFQTICLERSYPALVVKPYLMLADKAKTTNIDRLFSQFELLTHSAPGAPYREVEVRFHGDEDALRADHFLTKVDVGEEVSLLREEVTAAIAEFEASLTPKLTKISNHGTQTLVIFLHCWVLLLKILMYSTYW